MTPDPRYLTADSVHIVDGLRVWDYDLHLGSVDVAASGTDRASWDGWFHVRLDQGGRSLMNGERLTTLHPFTRVPAQSADQEGQHP